MCKSLYVYKLFYTNILIYKGCGSNDMMHNAEIIAFVFSVTPADGFYRGRLTYNLPNSFQRLIQG